MAGSVGTSGMGMMGSWTASDSFAILFVSFVCFWFLRNEGGLVLVGRRIVCLPSKDMGSLVSLTTNCSEVQILSE